MTSTTSSSESNVSGTELVESAVVGVGLYPSKAATFLTIDDITRVGDTILDALGRLKHMGAISEAQSALQTISHTLLGYVVVVVLSCRRVVVVMVVFSRCYSVIVLCALCML